MAYTSGRLWGGSKGLGGDSEPISTTSVNIREVLLQSDPTNTDNIQVGGANIQAVVLTPGQSITIPVISLSLVYAKMMSGSGNIFWLARD